MEITKIIEKNGYEEIEHCRCFMLSTESIWFIKSGKVNVFCVRACDDGSFGKRAYVTTFQQGDFLFPVGYKTIGNNKFCLIADPLADSRIVLIDNTVESLLDDKALTDHLINKLDLWISRISTVFIKDRMPLSCNIISYSGLQNEEAILSFEPDSSFSTDLDTGWVYIKKGIHSVCGNTDVLLAEGSIFPLSKNLWLKTAEASCISIASTESIARNRFISGIMKNFYHILFQCIVNNSAKLMTNAQDQNKYLIDLETKATASAFEELAALNRKRENTYTVSSESLVNPYTAVLELIGKYSNINFKFPENIPAEITGEKLLFYLLEYSSVYYRKIKLEDKWWKEESGNMVIFNRKTQLPTGLIYDKRKGFLKYDYQKNDITPITSADIMAMEDTGYTLYPQFPPEKLKLRNIILMAFMGLKSEFLLALGAGLAGGVVSLVLPYVTGIIFNSIIPSADMFQLYQTAVILFTSIIISVVFSLGQSLILLRIKTLSDYNLQAAVMGRLLKLPVNFFRQFSTGDLTQRVMGVETIRNIMADNVTHALFAMLFAGPNLVLMFYYSWKLSVIASLFLFVYMLVFIGISYVNCKNQERQLNIGGEINGFILQILNGINKIRHSISEKRVFNKWAAWFSEETRWEIRSIKNVSTILKFNSIFPVIITCFFFYLIGGLWKNVLNVGEYLSFNSAFTVIIGAISALAGIISSIVAVVPVYRRIKPVFEAIPESDINMKMPDSIEGNVELSHISYRYNPESPLVLKDINITANPGEFIAIVGPSGAGKSTLIRLLLGFEAPENGSIFYSGQDISTINTRELRKQIGVVLQSGSLITGSIHENIAGASEMTIEEVWEAARMAGCEKDISEMPMGMHTVVSNSTLSGGQRQRILIARALAKKPKLIIFDEATSALDNETQAQVSDSLDNMNVTRIVVAHRISTIEHADRIYVIDKGFVVQHGTFNELINQPGLFQSLAKRQMV